MYTTLEDVTYIIRFEEVIWGCALLAVNLVIHGFGMVMTLHLTNDVVTRLWKSHASASSMVSLIMGSWLIMLVHIVEVLMWSAFFQSKDCFANFSTAVYFAGLEYTTVGSALNLPRHWRLLEFMIASAGLMCFAWSTGVLMTLAQNFQEQQLGILTALGKRRHQDAPSATPAPRDAADES